MRHLVRERAFTATPMDALAQKLDIKPRQWTPETAEEVRQCVAEIMALAHQDAVDMLRSRIVEQEVLDILDAPTTRWSLARRPWIIHEDATHRDRVAR
jgi:hypothetical protein